MSLNEKIRTELEKLPVAIQEQVINKVKVYDEKVELLGLEVPENELFFDSLPRVWACSLFVAENCVRSPSLIHELVSSGDLFTKERRQEFCSYLDALKIDSEKTLVTVLRHFRSREMVRIAWRDLAGWSDLGRHGPERLYRFLSDALHTQQRSCRRLANDACWSPYGQKVMRPRGSSISANPPSLS